MTEEMNRDLKEVVDRRQNSGIIMNGAAEAAMQHHKEELKKDWELYATKLTLKAYIAALGAVMLIFGSGLLGSWLASKADSRIANVEANIVNVEANNQKIAERLESMDNTLRKIKGKLPALTIGTPQGWDTNGE